jgi:hypothetical protein
VHNIDITTFPDEKIDEEYGDVDVIVGGPPCQGFSSANRWQKEMEDPRNKLFFEYIRFVQRIHPKVIMIENVRGLLTRDNGYAIRRIEEILGAEGSILKYTGSTWRMNVSESEVLERLKSDSFAYALASLEHRRWCSYMASIGWRAGERSDRFRRNACLVTQQKLMESNPEMCKYDLMSLMERYRMNADR